MHAVAGVHKGRTLPKFHRQTFSQWFKSRDQRGGAGGRSSAPNAKTADRASAARSEEHTSELQSPCNLVCRLLLEKKKQERPPPGVCPHQLGPPPGGAFYQRPAQAGARRSLLSRRGGAR